jgi:hypothetical protein
MTRYSLWSFALALSVASTACGSDDDSGAEAPTGEHYGYVVATVDTRATNKLDIDGNGSPENKLGDLLGTLNALKFMVQPAIDAAVASGTVLLLVDVQTTSFSGAGAAGVAFYLGDSATATPAPCTDATMISTCGKHLAGTGTFTLAASSPRDTQLAGPFTGGTLKAGPGAIAIQIALTGAPVVVNLIGARAQISSVTADGIGKGIVGGAISQTELDNSIFPAIQAQLKTVIDDDCGAESVRSLGIAAGETVCGKTEGATFTPCAPGTGATALAAFDAAPAGGGQKDCKVSIEEIKTNSLVMPFLKPDVMVNGVPGVSVVLGFTAKKATFTP